MQETRVHRSWEGCQKFHERLGCACRSLWAPGACELFFPEILFSGHSETPTKTKCQCTSQGTKTEEAIILLDYFILLLAKQSGRETNTDLVEYGGILLVHSAIFIIDGSLLLVTQEAIQLAQHLCVCGGGTRHHCCCRDEDKTRYVTAYVSSHSTTHLSFP